MEPNTTTQPTIEKYPPVNLTFLDGILSFVYFFSLGIIVEIFWLSLTYVYDTESIIFEFSRSLLSPLGRDGMFVLYIGPIIAFLFKFFPFKKALSLSIGLILVASILISPFFFLYVQIYPFILATLLGGLLVGFISRFIVSKSMKVISFIVLIILGSMLAFRVKYYSNENRPISLSDCQAVDTGIIGYSEEIKSGECYHRLAVQNDEYYWCNKLNYDTSTAIKCVDEVLQKMNQENKLDGSVCTQAFPAIIDKYAEMFSRNTCNKLIGKYVKKF